MNDRAAYDRGSTIFSPDGRLYQVEYAREAVGRGSPSVGVRCEEGVALATRSPLRSPLVDPESVRKLHRIDDRILGASSGNAADARRLVDEARDIAVRERLAYDEAPDVNALSRALADLVQEHTQRGGTRPFGAALLVAGVDDDGTHLLEVDPSGAIYGWEGVAVGSGRESVQSELADADPPASLDGAVDKALAGLAADATETDLSPDSVGIATVDGDGVRTYPESAVADRLSGFDRAA